VAAGDVVHDGTMRLSAASKGEVCAVFCCGRTVGSVHGEEVRLSTH
jgi:hypothetical protein